MQSTPLLLPCKPITSNQIAHTKLDLNDITQSKMTIRRAQTYSAQSSSTAKWDRPLSFGSIRTRSMRNDNLGLARMCHSLLHFTYVGLLGFHCRTEEIILRHMRHDRYIDWMQKQKDKHVSVLRFYGQSEIQERMPFTVVLNLHARGEFTN